MAAYRISDVHFFLYKRRLYRILLVVSVATYVGRRRVRSAVSEHYQRQCARARAHRLPRLRKYTLIGHSKSSVRVSKDEIFGAEPAGAESRANVAKWKLCRFPSLPNERNAPPIRSPVPSYSGRLRVGTPRRLASRPRFLGRRTGNGSSSEF